MDDLTIARHCAKALELEVVETLVVYVLYTRDAETGRPERFTPTTDPAIAFRLESWLAERGTLEIDCENVTFFDRASPTVIGEYYTTHESRCAAVAKIVARVMEGQG